MEEPQKERRPDRSRTPKKSKGKERFLRPSEARTERLSCSCNCENEVFIQLTPQPDNQSIRCQCLMCGPTINGKRSLCKISFNGHGAIIALALHGEVLCEDCAASNQQPEGRCDECGAIGRTRTPRVHDHNCSKFRSVPVLGPHGGCRPPAVAAALSIEREEDSLNGRGHRIK